MRPWLLVAAGLIIVGGAAWKTKFGMPRDTIAYHYEQWLHQTQNLRMGIETNRFSMKKAIWYLDGKPSHNDRVEKIRKHEDALVRLGFFEQRGFEVKSGSETEFIQFYASFKNRAKQAGLESYSIRRVEIMSGQKMTVHFLARKEDVPAIQAVIKNIETACTNCW